MIRPPINSLIRTLHPEWDDTKRICDADLAEFRRRYVEKLLEDERGELSKFDEEVIASLVSGELLTANAVEDAAAERTFGERLADQVALFGGSWKFIIIFISTIGIWVTVNVIHAMSKPFDPYPFILLNLVLSCLAALQAPVIMMSQKRMDTKDRLRADNDYKINLKAELEIRQLNEKMDHQIARQWERLMEIQRIQMDMLEESTLRRSR